MPSVQDIITWVDRHYKNTETTANKIIDLEHIHRELFVRLMKLKDKYEVYATASIADQFTYNLPNDCDFNNIVSVRVSKSTTINKDTAWTYLGYAGLNDDISSGSYYGQAAGGVMAITENGKPLATTGLEIRVFYFKNPAAITATTDVPELDEPYHNLLKYALAQSLASQGSDPDTRMADYYQAKYDEFYSWAERDLRIKVNLQSVDQNNTVQWW
jgi:hypothetical protein